MSSVNELLNSLAPSAAQRAVREYLTEILTGAAVPGAHPAVQDIRGLDHSFSGVLQAIGTGHGTVPMESREFLAAALDPALVQLSKLYPAPVHRSFLSIQAVPNYRETGFIGAFDNLRLDQVSELGEIQVTETDAIRFELERGAVKQFGRVVRISRRDIVNDANGRFFANIGSALLAAAYRAEARAVYALLEANPNLRDGDTWFNDSNSTTDASVLGCVGKAFTKFASLQYPSGEYANATPAVFLVPASWNIDVQNIPADILLNRITVIRSADVTSGFLFADPNALPALALSGLSADVAPSIEVNPRPKMNLDVGLEIRCLHSFGVVPLSRMGVVKTSIAS